MWQGQEVTATSIQRSGPRIDARGRPDDGICLAIQAGIVNHEHAPAIERSSLAPAVAPDAQATTPALLSRAGIANHEAWERLLRFLANGEAPEAAVYERARNRLLQFFAARGTTGGEELADATFDRVIAKLSDEIIAQVRCPIGYVLRFAHYIHLEHIKSEIARQHRLAALPPEEADHLEGTREQWLRNERLALVERCLDDLAPAERTLLRSYYMHDGRSRITSRQQMSRALGITPALLRTRVSRLLGAFNQRVRALAEAAALA